MKKYLFTSERLGFRQWDESDIDPMIQINGDAEVMEFFPSIATPSQTLQFIERMKFQFAKRGFCYFAVDILETGEFIGFTGLSEQIFPSDFTPFIDVGWRIDKKYWNNGYATEGAKRCVKFGFENLQIDRICAVAPVINEKSIRIMTKIGMKKVKLFKHPFLVHDKRFETCVLYALNFNLKNGMH